MPWDCQWGASGIAVVHGTYTFPVTSLSGGIYLEPYSFFPGGIFWKMLEIHIHVACAEPWTWRGASLGADGTCV